MTEITISSYSELKEVIVENLKDGRVLSLSFEEGGDEQNQAVIMTACKQRKNLQRSSQARYLAGSYDK